MQTTATDHAPLDATIVKAAIYPSIGVAPSNNRLEATAEESKTLLSGTLAHYGTYSVADNVLVFHIERSTFPNWDGIEQRRPFTLKGDELTYTTPGSTGAGATQIIWRRAG
jgi:hypothetical protein